MEKQAGNQGPILTTLFQFLVRFSGSPLPEHEVQDELLFN
jgi:hypothetical protein